MISPAALLLAAGLFVPSPAPQKSPELLRRVRFRNPPTLASLQNPVFPGSIPKGSKITLGSIFSSLFRDPLEPESVFWAANDRGPNDEITVGGETRRIFLEPGHAPAILQLRAGAEGIRLEKAIFLRTADGKPVSGVSNRPGADERPYDGTGRLELAFDGNGMDTEALERVKDGSFWLGEEYAPSVVHVASDGRVLTRFTPAGSRVAPPGYPVAETLPAIYARRKANRGFEALAASRDGARLFAVLQSPLENPDMATGDASRIVRLLVLDAESGRPVAEHVMVAEEAAALGETRQSEVKINEAKWLNARTLLIVEGTDAGAARVFSLDLSRATNILATAWDDPHETPSLEALTPGEIGAKGISPAQKTLVVDLNAVVPDLPRKIEGLAIVDERTLVVGNDNEFAVRGPGGSQGPESELVFIRLPKPLPLDPDIHTQANVEAVRPAHMSLDLTLDFEARRIRGSSEMTLAYAPGADPDHLDLDTSKLTIESVKDAATGRDLNFDLEPAAPFLGQRLVIALGRPRPARVRVKYLTSPEASALQWLDPRQTTSRRMPFLLTQSQAIHARSWVPCADSPGARITYDAVVHAPAGMGVVMSAESVGQEPSTGTFRFRMSEPIPPYLLALAAGEIAFQKVGPRTGVFAEPAVLPRAASEFRDMEAMLETAERLFGKYRWGRWDAIVLPPSFPYGGMENPRITFATPTIIAGDRSLVDVMAHELAHSWSGNLVTSATWHDFWLNEGFTTYLENRIVEDIYGKEVADMHVLLANRKLRVDVAALLKEGKPGDTQLAQGLIDRDPDDAGAVAYEKGSGFLRVLEKRLGRKRLDSFLRSYFDGNAFQGMTTSRLLELLKSDLFRGDEKVWSEVHVAEWIYGRGIPASLVEPPSPRFDRARAAAEQFAKTGATEGVRKDWVTAEWQEFLGSLPKPMTGSQMEALDRAWGFSSQGNAEVLSAWLEHVVAAGYEPAYPALERFLLSHGRRKFLKLLYERMEANEKTQALARAIYTQARPGYHPIAVSTVDLILRWPAEGASAGRTP